VPAPRLTESEIAAAKQSYERDGFFILRNVVSKERLTELHRSLSDAFNTATTTGTLFKGGGLFSGHLNCFPGAGARFAYETLQERGIIDLMKQLHPLVLRMPNVGCNFNLPGSHTQHWHIDRPFTRDFMIANITVVDTTVKNGATDVIPGTHKKFYKYTRFVMEKRYRDGVQLITNQGDVVVRSSNVWHRGMTNHSTSPRPMLAFTWEDGGSNEPDPFTANGGQIRFIPNWFKLNAAGRFRERLFVKVPAAYTALRLARSLVDKEY
jgi:ectoine hydroxylase-related dioxygenase (phytanoyl-CoA dioxygenase family)